MTYNKVGIFDWINHRQITERDLLATVDDMRNGKCWRVLHIGRKSSASGSLLISNILYIPAFSLLSQHSLFLRTMLPTVIINTDKCLFLSNGSKTLENFLKFCRFFISCRKLSEKFDCFQWSELTTYSCNEWHDLSQWSVSTASNLTEKWKKEITWLREWKQEILQSHKINVMNRTTAGYRKRRTRRNRKQEICTHWRRNKSLNEKSKYEPYLDDKTRRRETFNLQQSRLVFIEVVSKPVRVGRNDSGSAWLRGLPVWIIFETAASL